ncbi:MAG: MFS transporter [Anaerolineales bacterium]|uniref:MFS transporter n=1 Tax=Candidatus Villigracilis proximus TaxID=3140683 RepID=UPI0031370033|nr:MFS transporter [Anaerolineales bacterium]
MKNHSLITTLKNLTGNPRGCVYPEPLWGIPFNLYAPYASIYMVAIGLTDKQIGLIVSISWGFQVLLALLSGVVTDKLGRRLTTLIFDILSWTIPSLISAVAQNFWYFLAAGIINSVWRITHNSWSCLLVEDAEEDQLVDIYTWIYIANQIVGFVAPLAGILIGIFSLVPTVRGLYFFAAFMFTLKAVVTYQMTQETKQGIIRLHETRHQSVFSVLGEYKGVFQNLLKSPATLYTAGIMLVISISAMISGSFWGIIVTEKLNIPAQNLALFPFVKTAIMLVFFFLINPVLNRLHFKLPMTIGFLGFIISQILLITAPEKGYFILLISVFLEACSFAAVSPLVDRLIALTIDPKERARIQSILYVGVILLTSPFGWIAGTLSTLNKDLPFVINIILFTAGAGLAYLGGKASQGRQKSGESRYFVN